MKLVCERKGKNVDGEKCPIGGNSGAAVVNTWFDNCAGHTSTACVLKQTSYGMDTAQVGP